MTILLSTNSISPQTIRLLDAMDGKGDGWGHLQGRAVHGRLLDLVEKNNHQVIFPISLDGVKRTDASFPRESVFELAKRFRGKKGFYLKDVDDDDLLENWHAAATRTEQPLVVWSGNRYTLLGSEPSAGCVDLFKLIMSEGTISAAACATRLGIKLTNASNKLKFLFEQGYVLRSEGAAPSGGIEFLYFRIK